LNFQHLRIFIANRGLKPQALTKIPEHLPDYNSTKHKEFSACTADVHN